MDIKWTYWISEATVKSENGKIIVEDDEKRFVRIHLLTTDHVWAGGNVPRCSVARSECAGAGRGSAVSVSQSEDGGGAGARGELPHRAAQPEAAAVRHGEEAERGGGGGAGGRGGADAAGGAAGQPDPAPPPPPHPAPLLLHPAQVTPHS